MDLGRAFAFVFDDPDWLRKVGLNALIALIPIIGPLYLLGWGLEVAKRVAARGLEPLPDIDFGTYLVHGFRAFVVSLVYTAPLWISNIVAAILFSAVREVGQGPTNALVGIGTACGGLLVLIFLMLLALVLPAAMTRSAVFGSIEAGLHFRAVWGMVRAAPGAYIVAFIASLLTGFAAAFLGGLACGIGIIFTMAYYQVISGHLYGQAYLAGAPGSL